MNLASSKPVSKPTTSVVNGNSKSAGNPIKGVDPKMQNLILDEIMDKGTAVKWEDIGIYLCNYSCNTISWIRSSKTSADG